MDALPTTAACCELDFLPSAGLVAIRWGFAQWRRGMQTFFKFALLSSMDGLKPIQTRYEGQVLTDILRSEHLVHS